MTREALHGTIRRLITVGAFSFFCGFFFGHRRRDHGEHHVLVVKKLDARLQL